MNKHAAYKASPSTGRACLVFALIAALWFAFDRLTKQWADTVEVGHVLVKDVLGIAEFRLAHNTGAAWGMFDNATFALGVFSLVICAIILIYVCVAVRKGSSWAEIIALACVFAGGAGNAFDRFAWGYVVDFINPTIINYPTFNVADIGVTCGIIAFCFALLVRTSTEGQQ